MVSVDLISWWLRFVVVMVVPVGCPLLWMVLFDLLGLVLLCFVELCCF